ncbi:MAG: leucine-rich repeat domain-containing protein [Muribaculaceae bacterium]|nr:leucine-rich repeat domain-containing protein [Muribaculaceae bacterium]
MNHDKMIKITNHLKSCILIIVTTISVQFLPKAYASQCYYYHPLNPEIIQDGIRYALDFFSSPAIPDYSDIDNDSRCLENLSNVNRMNTSVLCGANNYMDEYPWPFTFINGYSMPAFEQRVLVRRSNAPFRYSYRSADNQGYIVGYDAETDEMAKRPQYYSGEIWIPDSISMPAVPDYHNEKYYYVCGFEIDRDKSDYGQYAPYLPPYKLFGDDLTFIRIPKYMALQPNTFYGTKGLKKVQIGSVGWVDRRSFNDCPSLETVFMENFPGIFDAAFFKCPNIKYIVIDGVFSPDLLTDEIERHPFVKDIVSNNYVIDEDIYQKATLYVHEDQIDTFRASKTWGKFLNIRPIEEYYAGVNTINSDNDTDVNYQVFTISGLPVKTVQPGEVWHDNLPNGIYIVKSSNGTVSKQYLR